MEHQRANPQVFKYTLVKFLFGISCLLLFSCKVTLAQTAGSDNKKAIKLFTEAKEYYQTYKLTEAANSLRDALEKDPNYIEAHTLLAYIFIDQGNYGAAKLKFQEAIALNPTAIPNNLFFLGELEIKNGEYETAKKHFNQFLTLSATDPSLKDRSRQNLETIDFAEKSIANPVKFEPENLGPNINSELAEYFPCLTVDENTILFTRRLQDPNSPQGFNEDFYVSYKIDGAWQEAVNLKAPINTSNNEGAPSLSADGQILIYTACELYGDYGANRNGYGSCDLFYAAKDGKNWTNPVNLGKTINTNNWETQPSFSADGKTLYFVRGVRDRSGQRTGDIYMSVLGEDSYWGKPVRLNANINTSQNEESVFIHPDGKTLYFSSDGHLGMGGLDIFMSKKDSNGVWGEAINLGYPINTHKNENSLLVSADGKSAFFASDRTEGYGNLDLYSFELPSQFAPQLATYFAGKIYDKKTKEPLSAKFELIDLNTEQLVVESYSNKQNGEFLVTLPSGTDYALNVSKDGYLFYSENFALAATKDNAPVKKDVPLQAIAIGESIVLKNIFFETAKYELKLNSKVELDRLVLFMKKNTKVKIEISGHTDNVGNSANNLTLSKNRAKAVYDHLTKSGINPERMEWKGYGSNQPIATNDTEKGRALNRRTEFKIIGK